MRLIPFALLGAFLPGLASAQGVAATPIQRCEQNSQVCVRECAGSNAQSCMANCAGVRAHCIQNPSTALQPRR